MTSAAAEGWYVDPYGRHEARWFSAGVPTALVRDAEVESSEDPPAEPFTGELEPILGQPVADGADLLRVDQAEEPETPSDRARVPFDVLDQFGDRQ